MSEPKKKSARTQLVLIAIVFFGPLVVAAWLYYQGEFFQPASRTNVGALLEPIVNLKDEIPDSPLHEHNASAWLLIYANTGECGEDCRNSLFTIRQLRLMLGKDMDRVGRVFLHGESLPDTVFLADEHTGLIALRDDATSDFLTNKKPGELAAGGYYLVDPHGNLVMYFHPGLDPGDVLDDLKKLLRLSRIG